MLITLAIDGKDLGVARRFDPTLFDALSESSRKLEDLKQEVERLKLERDNLTTNLRPKHTVKEEVLRVILEGAEGGKYEKAVNLTKNLAIDVTRKNPTEWNEFLTVCFSN